VLDKEATYEVKGPMSWPYDVERQEYWSTQCADMRLACVIYPRTALDVSKVVGLLAASTENFAIESGDHSPNAYFGSVDGGPLISTKNLNQVQFDSNTKTVRLGPGSRWHG
jgi:FAD/FMN-containing dehydrogenase